ncbi:MAG: hypothetical protein L6306_14795 [Planctomycetales bacterium]|nr:hypothetical protein [Planctomycetales bacterium]
MRILRLRQTIEIIEAESMDKMMQGGGEVIQASNHPIVLPLGSFDGVGGLPVNIDNLGGIVATARAAIASQLE